MLADLYARKSTQDQGRSAARQERDWRADCEREGISPGRVFVDPDLSASRYARKERPDYANLLAHIRSGQCEMVSMWEASRGSRQLGEWIAFLELCREHGVLIRIFGEDARTFDVRTRRDWRQLAEEGLDAHDESAKLSDRVCAGTRDAARNGKPPGPLLYGFSRVYDGRGRFVEQVVNPEQAAIIRKVAEDTLAGIPLQTQARALNDAGVPTPSGKGRWIGAHLNRLLRNPGLVGHRVHLGQVVAEDCWPAILDPDDFRRLAVLLSDPGRRNSQNAALTYQLSGAARCGVCRRPLRAKRLGPQRALRYWCPWSGCQKVSAPLAAMDALVDEVIRARLREPDAAAVFAPDTDDAAIAAARKQLGELQDRLDEHVRESAAGRLSARSLGMIEQQLQPQIDAAERKWRALLTPPALKDVDPVALADDWPDVPVGRRRTVILALAEIVLSPVGKSGRWSHRRLGESRWVNDPLTWGDRWRAEGLV